MKKTDNHSPNYQQPVLKVVSMRVRKSIFQNSPISSNESSHEQYIINNNI